MTVQFALSKREEEYTFSCKMVKVAKWFEDIDSKNNITKQSTEMVYLVPQDSSQRTLFFDAWLPSYDQETYETVGLLLSPINKPCRLGVRRINADYSEAHHLVLMSPDLEDEISKMISAGKSEITVAILAESNEEKFNV